MSRFKYYPVNYTTGRWGIQYGSQYFSQNLDSYRFKPSIGQEIDDLQKDSPRPEAAGGANPAGMIQ